MLPNGPACASCLLGREGRVFGEGLLQPDGLMRLGVMIVGETLGAADAKQEKALVGAGGMLFARAMQRKRRSRDDFRYNTAMWCKPSRDIWDSSGKRLTAWAKEAAHYCPYMDEEIDRLKPKAILALGDVAFEKLTGLNAQVMGARKDFMKGVRGYAFRDLKDRTWVIPTYHPDFIRMGNQHHAQTLMFDMEKAIKVAQTPGGYTHETIECLMDPSLPVWEAYVRDLLAFINNEQRPRAERAVALDIETPYKGDRSEDELKTGEDITYRIDRISFAFEAHRGASVIWQLPYTIGIKQIIEAVNRKGLSLIWNRPYDRPRIEKALGVSMPIEHCLDAMDAFHVLFNSQDRALGYATSMLPSSWRLKAWKHLSRTEPAYYSCLRSTQKVVLFDGTTRLIRDIVRNREAAVLRGMDEEGREIPVTVVGWHRNPADRPWHVVRVEATNQPIYCTHDHKVWTPNGWVQADALQPGDVVYSSKLGSDSLIHGSLLGDGHVDKRGRLSITHTAPQRAWLELKQHHFGVRQVVRHDTHYTGGTSHRIEVGVSPTLWRKRFYPNGKRVFIPPPDSAALAVWYLDDGCHAISGGVTSNPRFAAYGFVNYADVVAWFQGRWGAENVSEYTIRPNGSTISLKVAATSAFFEEVAPWVPPCMEYKLPSAYRGRYNGWLAVRVPQKSVVISSQPDTQVKKSARYCVDVDHPTHRFFTLGGLVKNCVDSVALLRNWHDIQTLLAASGQTEVYDQICVHLDPVLEWMTQQGMLVDPVAHATLRADLETRIVAQRAEMSRVVPPEVRSTQVWKTRKAAESGLAKLRAQEEVFPEEELFTVPGSVKEMTCLSCGAHPVTKAHTTKKNLPKAKQSVVASPSEGVLSV